MENRSLEEAKPQPQWSCNCDFEHVLRMLPKSRHSGNWEYTTLGAKASPPPPEWM